MHIIVVIEIIKLLLMYLVRDILLVQFTDLYIVFERVQIMNDPLKSNLFIIFAVIV